MAHRLLPFGRAHPPPKGSTRPIRREIETMSRSVRSVPIGPITPMVAMVAFAIAALAACGDSLGVGGPQSVAVNFQVLGSGAAPVGPNAGGPSQVAGPPLVVVGTNGTLAIDEIRVIVSEVELEGE